MFADVGLIKDDCAKAKVVTSVIKVSLRGLIGPHFISPNWERGRGGEVNSGNRNPLDVGLLSELSVRVSREVSGVVLLSNISEFLDNKLN